MTTLIRQLVRDCHIVREPTGAGPGTSNPRWRLRATRGNAPPAAEPPAAEPEYEPGLEDVHVDLAALPADRVCQALRAGAQTADGVAGRAKVTLADARRICHTDDRIERRGARRAQPLFGLTGEAVIASAAGDPIRPIARGTPQPPKPADRRGSAPGPRGRSWAILRDGRARTIIQVAHELSEARGLSALSVADVALEVGWLERHGHVRREQDGKYRRVPT